VKRSQWFPVAKASVPQARQFVADCLRDLDPEIADVAEGVELAALLVSELATNALLHAGSEFEVTIDYPSRSGRLRIEVADRHRSRPTPLNPPATMTHGRRLLLVSTLSAAWGVREAGRRSGKTIWFELTAAGASVPAAPSLRQGRPVREGRSILGRRAWRGTTLSFRMSA
jgi:anti-sigma regulatory factor (Ser/Thr protein kinase)